MTGPRSVSSAQHNLERGGAAAHDIAFRETSGARDVLPVDEQAITAGAVLDQQLAALR